MNRRTFLCGLTLGAVAAPLAAEGQQAGKMWRVGFVVPASREAALPILHALVEGLRAHGYREGQNLTIESRLADGKLERLPDLAAELASLHVDVIVVSVDRVAVAVKPVVAKIPIVMAVAEDPVGAGLVESIAHPGGNLTGLTIVTGPEIFGKNLELLKDALPRGARIAVLFNPTSRINALYLKTTEQDARKLSLSLVPAGAHAPEDVEKAFALMKQRRATGFIVLGEPLFYNDRQHINDLAIRNGLAAMWPCRECVDTGGLMAYGAAVTDLFRRAATFVDKIIKGAKPGDLPMEQPTRFEFVINLKTAKALGLTIPPSLLLRADQVIE